MRSAVPSDKPNQPDGNHGMARKEAQSSTSVLPLRRPRMLNCCVSVGVSPPSLLINQTPDVPKYWKQHFEHLSIKGVCWVYPKGGVSSTTLHDPGYHQARHRYQLEGLYIASWLNCASFSHVLELIEDWWRCGQLFRTNLVTAAWEAALHKGPITGCPQTSSSMRGIVTGGKPWLLQKTTWDVQVHRAFSLLMQ